MLTSWRVRIGTQRTARSVDDQGAVGGTHSHSVVLPRLDRQMFPGAAHRHGLTAQLGWLQGLIQVSHPMYVNPGSPVEGSSAKATPGVASAARNRQTPQAILVSHDATDAHSRMFNTPKQPKDKSLAAETFTRPLGHRVEIEEAGAKPSPFARSPFVPVDRSNRRSVLTSTEKSPFRLAKS